jgi:cytochrome P450
MPAFVRGRQAREDQEQLHFSRGTGCFLDQLYARGQAEFGVDVGEVRLHGTMLTFGGGIHYCLGAHLARAELAEALTVITRRMPNPRCSGPAPWKPLIGITGPTTLPIEFDAGH